MNINGKVLSILRQHLCIDEDSPPLGLDDNLHTVHGADSLDHVEIFMALEDEFGIEFSDTDAEKCKTPRDWIKLCLQEKS